MLLLALHVALQPGVKYQAALDPQATKSLELTHDSLKYSFFVALEGDTTDLRFNALLCKSAVDYADCNSQSGKCLVQNNTRTSCNLNSTGTYTLFVKNTGNLSGNFHLVYDDSVLVVPPAGTTYKAADYGTAGVQLRIPVCSRVQNFTIKTNGSNIYYSFNAGRPANKLTTQTLQPEYPGFLYISINDSAADFQAYQYFQEAIELDGYTQAEVASWKGCNRVFQFKSPGTGKDIVAAASEVDDLMIGQMQMYYRENFTGTNYATSGDNNGMSVEQLLRTKTVGNVALSAITIEMPQKYGWLPHWYEVNKNLQLYTFMYYVSSNNTGILPGQLINYNVNKNSYVIAIPFRTTQQVIQTDNAEVKSNYVIRMNNTQTKGDGNATLQFGHITPEDNSFKVFTRGDNIFESAANYSANNSYMNDLFFATITCKNVQCSGNFRAEQVYKLQPRTEIFFSHQSWETDPTNYFMYYDLADKGIDLRINHHENITIYLSQTDMLPLKATTQKLIYTCPKSPSVCNITIGPDQGLTSNVDVFITIVANGSLSVTAANVGENVLSLTEAVPAFDYLYIGNTSQAANMQYIFDPNHQTSNGDERTKEFTLFNFEAIQLQQAQLPDNVTLKLYVSSEVNPGPENYITARGLSEGQIEQSVLDQNITKIQMTVPTPYGKRLYFGIYCEGSGCIEQRQTLLRISYRLTAYTAEEMAEQSPDVMQKNYFFTRNATMLEYFNLLDEETADLNINFDSDQSCAGIEYDIFTCTGAIASTSIITSNYSQSYCQHHHGSQQRPLSISLDSASDRVSAGNVYLTIIPDFKNFTGSRSVVDYCQNIYALYKSEQIVDFQQPQYGEIYTPGILNGVHFMAKVPAITQKSINGTNLYGDRLIIKVESTKKLRVCVTDILRTYYPSPLQRQCINTNTEPLEMATEFAVNFQHYLNMPSTGAIMSHTNVYFTIWTDDEFQNREKCKFNITIAPQAVIDPRAEGYPMTFIAKQLNGLDRFINYAFNLSNLSQVERSHMAFTAGPYCNDSYCRSDTLPEEFYAQTLITSVSSKTMIPVEDTAEGNFYNRGPTIFQLDNVANTSAQMVYITLEYRRYNRLSASNKRSSMAYQVDVIQNYNVQANNIDYQTTKTRDNSSGSAAVMDYYHSELSYIPSEVVLYPCRGRPSLLLDQISPLSNPAYGDYQQMLTNDWGRPIFYQFFDDRISDMQTFITVFDQQKFDFASNKFISDSSNMEYQISIGNQVESTKPGNQGQLTVTKYSPSGKGKVSVKFYPASLPNQQSNVSDLNYYMYAVPYKGSFDQDVDYSPYTACGAKHSGYSIYKNAQGGSNIQYDVKQVGRDGFIEVTSNQDLWEEAPPGAILYVTILTDTVAYVGILAGQEEASAGLLMMVTFSVVIVIILVLLLVFWSLFIRLRKQKISGYKPVTE